MDSDDLQLWRLDLRSDFTGYLACGQEAWGFEAYKVSHWTLNNYALVTEIKPVGTNAEPIYLKGNYSGSVLDLEVGGVNGGWKLPVTLHREPKIEEYNRQAKEKIWERETK